MKIGTGVAAAVIVASLVIIGSGPVTTAFGQGNMPSGGMMGGPFPASAHPISTVQAEQILREWPAAHHLDGLVLDEVEVYTENIYGQFKEQSTGRGAIQVLVDRYTGRAVPEMGPNVMWNSKYGRAMMQAMMDGMGMMGGMMGNGGMMGGGMTSQPSPAPSTAPVTEAQARQNANRFLAGYFPGTMVGDADTFYGYYHFDVVRGGRQVAMLSANASTGQVWYHTWHGEFLSKHEVGRP